MLGLARHARSSEFGRGPLLVTGTLADQLARELGAGGEPGAVRTTGEPGDIAALVHVLGGAPTEEDERLLRAAARALVPIVVVQLGDTDVRLPYVLATDVVTSEPGRGFPVDEIATLLAGSLGTDGAVLARKLPVLRDAYEEQRAEETAVTAAVIAATGGDVPKLPVLALAQARVLTDIETARGSVREDGPAGAVAAVGPPLGAALGTGLAARTVVRRLPFRNRLLDAAVAGAATYALTTVFRRFVRR
jgi:hypothetical protein